MGIIRKIKKKWYEWKIKRKLAKLYPVHRKQYKDLDFVKNLIVMINRGMALYRYHYDSRWRKLGEIKDDLIEYLLRNFREEIKVGYLVGALHSTRLDEDYEFFESEEDIIRDLKIRYKGRLVSYRIYPKCWDAIYEWECEWYVKAFYWTDEDYLYYYHEAKRRSFESLEEDYYGLVEINVNGTKIHFLAPRISRIAPYIGKFDYICSRWRVYGWKKYTDLDKVSEKDIALAVWYSSHISSKARETLFEWFVLRSLIEDRRLLVRWEEVK